MVKGREQYKTITTVVVISLVLAACGETPEEKKRAEYSQLDDREIARMLETGQHQKALEAIQIQIDQEIADGTDFIHQAKIYLAFLDGIAAEASIERARDTGVSRDDTALMLARAFMLQQTPLEAKEALNEVNLAGDAEFEATILKGDIEKELGDIKGARYFYRLAMDLRPEDFRGYLGMSMLALGQGALKEAEEWAAQAATKVDDDSIVRYVRGTVARYQRRPEDAEAHLRRSVDLHPANLLAHFELIALLIETDQYEEADSALDAVYARAPESPMAQYYSALLLAANDNVQEAEHLLLRVGDLTRRYPPAARAYGHVLFRLQKYSTARPYLERVLARLPADRLTRLALAECLTRRGDAERALGILQPLLVEGSDDLDARFQEAAAQGALGRLPETRESLRQARAIAEAMGDEGTARAHALSQRLALTRFIEGDETGAIEELKAYYADKPQDKESLMLLANLQLEAGDIQGAEAVAGEVLRLDPGGAESANLLGAVRVHQGRFDEALDLLNTALARSPEYQSALKNRALTFMGLVQHENAQKDLEHLVEMGVQDGQVMGMLGRVYLELGRPADANRYLKVAAEIIPESAIIATDLAEALALSGYRSSAMAQAQQARKLAYRDPSLEKYIDGLVLRWQEEEAEASEQEAAKRAEEREKFAKERAEREKARQAILDEAGIKQDQADTKGKDGNEAESEEAEEDPAPDNPEDKG